MGPKPIERLEAILAENPDTFPSTRSIDSMLREHGKSRGWRPSGEQIAALQMKWVSNCSTKAFFREASGNRFTGNISPGIKDAVKERFSIELFGMLRKRPHVFPTPPSIERIARERGLEKDAESIRKRLGKKAILEKQLEWTKNAGDLQILSSIKDCSAGGSYPPAKKALKGRFRGILEKAAGENPGRFPSKEKLAAWMREKYGDVAPGTVSIARWAGSKKIREMQESWIRESDELDFLAEFFSGFIRVGKNQKEFASEKAKGAVLQLARKEGIFPAGNQLIELLRKNGIDTDKSMLPRKLGKGFALSAQEEWLEGCSRDELLESLNAHRLGTLKGRRKSILKHRFTGVSLEALAENPGVFPSTIGIARLLKTGGKRIVHGTVAKNINGLEKIQLDWILNSGEEHFLKETTRGSLDETRGVVREEFEKRLAGIVLERIPGETGLPCSRVEKLAEKFPSIIFMESVAGEGMLTPDQEIATRARIWKKNRDDALHSMIGQRLEQLWGFRELLALLKDGRCMHSDVVSFLHQSIEEKTAKYIPGSGIKHSFLDEVFEGEFRAGGDVLLLSLLHRLTEKQAGELLIRLNSAVEKGAEVIATLPATIKFSEEMANLLSSFGFMAEKTGTLHLFPPEHTETREADKLLTCSTLLTFRKSHDADLAPETAGLFSQRLTQGGRRGGLWFPGQGITCSAERLSKSEPAITLRDVGSVLTGGTPKVKNIMLGRKEALVELEGGAVVGFNMDPKHPYSVEIEGAWVPKEAERAAANLTQGKKEFLVPVEMRKKYREMAKMASERKGWIIGPHKRREKANGLNKLVS